MRSRFGGETVEAAILLPLILLLVFAGMEFGWLVLRGVQLDAAARAGSREAALSGSSIGSVNQAIDSSMSNSGIDEYTVEIDPANPALAEPGTPVHVSVRAEYADVGLLGFGNVMPLPSYITGTSSMLKEEP